jgi:formate C-acetyltransferase
MYEFRSVTERMKVMHERTRERIYHVDSESTAIITQASKQYESMLPPIKNAMIFKTMCEKFTTRVEDHEILVANRTKYFCGTYIDPRWGGGGMYVAMAENGMWTLGDDGMYHNPPSDELRLVMSKEDMAVLKENAPYWQNRTMNDIAAAWHPESYEEIDRLGVRSFGSGMPIVMMPTGHSTPGYKKILQTGYAAIRKQARDWMDEHDGNLMGEDINKYTFYASVDIVCQGAITYIKRYAQTCYDAAEKCTDPARKAELIQMGDNLMWISENPVKTYWQACQATLLYEHMISLSGVTDIGSFGRFDQYTWPYLKDDLEQGRITMDQAQEITDCFFMKINSFYNGGTGPLTVIIGIGNTYLHTTVGGVDPDTGEDATNPVTYMTLETLGRLSLHDPTVSLRVNKNTPDKLWECAIQVNRMVGGLPLFQNDEVIIPGAMRELGFSLHDARDYALIGCQEVTGSGNDYAGGNGTNPPEAYTQYSTILDMAINDGVNPYNKVQCKIHTGYLYEMNSLDEVKDAFEKIMRYVIKGQVTIQNFAEQLFMRYDQHPILSISMEGCMESGKDVVCGGAKYNSYGCTAVGLATVADSLTTIKYMCFDKKLCTTRELYDAVMDNWQGHEILRQQILNEVPHYGNADPYADMEMKWVVDKYYEICKECYSVRCRIFKGGMYGAADHIAQGYTTWGTPDGRIGGTPIADAASPAQGRDKNGPTAVLMSALSFEQGKFMNGLALNLRIHPSALSREDGIGKLRDITRAYLDQGGMEVQYNIVSAETMRAAQKDPETYRDLVVRIAGYSAYFVELGLDGQNDLINRTENNL